MKGLSSILLVAAIGVTGLGSLALGQEPSAIPRGPINQARAVARRQAVQARIARHFPGVRFSERTSGITRVYGQAFGFGDTPQQAAEDFLVSYSEMFGVARDQLAPRGVQEVMGGKFKAMYYEQTYNGVPVHHGRVTLLTRSDLGNAVVLAAPHLYDLSGAEPAAVRLTAGQVLAEMQRRYPVFTFTEPELVVYLDTVGEEARPMYAYRFIGGNTAKELPEKYEFMVDASSDEALIVNLRSMILFEDLEGTVTGMGTSGELPDRADNLPVEKPLEDMWVRIVEGNAGYTASNGDYAIADAGADPVTAEASVAGLGATEAGRWVRVIDTAGDELALDQEVTPPGPADFLFNPSPAEFLTAQVNGFIFTTEVHNFVKSIDPSYPLSFEEMPCYVNRSGGYCPGNAWYDYSSINFCRAASGYPNTAYSSVIFHEYGHHVVDSGHPTATGDYHEGLADVTANLLMETSCLGRGFSGGSSCLRNAYNSVSYPCSGDAHYCGQVLSGAFWLTRDELVLTEPDDYLEIIRSLYLNSILLQPAAVSPDITIDVLTLDDDDGDLDNGTPHWEEICSGFGAKNLDCPELLALDFYYPNGRPQPADRLRNQGHRPRRNAPFGHRAVALLAGRGRLRDRAHERDSGQRVRGHPADRRLRQQLRLVRQRRDCGGRHDNRPPGCPGGQLRHGDCHQHDHYARPRL